MQPYTFLVLAFSILSLDPANAEAQTGEVGAGGRFQLRLGLLADGPRLEGSARFSESGLSQHLSSTVPIVDTVGLRWAVGAMERVDDEWFSASGSVSIVTAAGEVGAAVAGGVGPQRPLTLDHRLDEPWLWTNHSGAAFYRTSLAAELQIPRFDFALRLELEPNLAVLAMPAGDGVMSVGGGLEASLRWHWLSVGAVQRVAWLSDGRTFTEVGGFVQADLGAAALRASLTALHTPESDEPVWTFQLGAVVPLD